MGKDLARQAHHQQVSTPTPNSSVQCASAVTEDTDMLCKRECACTRGERAAVSFWWDPPVVEVDHPLGKGRQCVIGAHSTSSRSAGCIREGDVDRASHLCAKTTQGTQPRHVLALWTRQPFGAATRITRCLIATLRQRRMETHCMYMHVHPPLHANSPRLRTAPFLPPGSPSGHRTQTPACRPWGSTASCH